MEVKMSLQKTFFFLVNRWISLIWNAGKGWRKKISWPTTIVNLLCETIWNFTEKLCDQLQILSTNRNYRSRTNSIYRELFLCERVHWKRIYSIVNVKLESVSFQHERKRSRKKLSDKILKNVLNYRGKI